jgi:caspase domain-containing protein
MPICACTPSGWSGGHEKRKRVFVRALIRILRVLGAACALCSAEVQRIAVFIGVDEGLEDERPLRYAARDARAMADAFRKAGTFDEDRIYLLANPSLDRILATLEEVKGRARELRKAGTESLAMIYFSGHGGAEGLHVGGRGWPREDLTGYLESLESNMKILIVDACESGDLLRRKGGRLIEGPKVVQMDRLEGRGTIMISSSSRGEMAQESEDYHGAVFTHHFLNGLRGLADYDRDKSIRLMEAFDYARVSTKREEIMGQSSQQNPEFDFDMMGESDPVLAKIGQRQSRLLLHRMPAGLMEIYDGNSMALASKVWLTGQDSLSFMLPSNKYILAYRDHRESRVAEVDLTWQTMAMVRPDVFSRKAKSLLYDKGGRILDMHYNGIQFSARRAPMFRMLNLSQVEYVFRGYWTKQTLGLSLAATHMDGGGTGLENSIRMAGLGYGVETPLIRLVHGQLLVGAQASYHWVFQTVSDGRFGTSPVEAGGRLVGADRESTSGLSRFTLPLECEIYFPHRFWLSGTLAPAYYLYNFKTAGSAREPWGWEPAVSFGHQF